MKNSDNQGAQYESTIFLSFQIHNVKVTNPQQTSNELAEYFSNIGSNLLKNIKETNQGELSFSILIHRKIRA